MKKIAMINIKTILRLRHDLKLSRDDIVAASGVRAGTVSNVLERALSTAPGSRPEKHDSRKVSTLRAIRQTLGTQNELRSTKKIGVNP